MQLNIYLYMLIKCVFVVFRYGEAWKRAYKINHSNAFPMLGTQRQRLLQIGVAFDEHMTYREASEYLRQASSEQYASAKKKIAESSIDDLLGLNQQRNKRAQIKNIEKAISIDEEEEDEQSDDAAGVWQPPIHKNRVVTEEMPKKRIKTEKNRAVAVYDEVEFDDVAEKSIVNKNSTDNVKKAVGRPKGARKRNRFLV